MNDVVICSIDNVIVKIVERVSKKTNTPYRCMLFIFPDGRCQTVFVSPSTLSEFQVHYLEHKYGV